LEQQKVQIEQMEVARKAKKDEADNAVANKKLEIDTMKAITATQAQEKQAAGRLKLDALKTLATPKQSAPSAPAGKKE